MTFIRICASSALACWLLVLTSCSSTSKPEEAAPAVAVAPENIQTGSELNRYEQLLALESRFKYRNLQEFTQIDTFNWETRPGNYQALDSASFHLVWQDTTRQFIGEFHDQDYLYSWHDSPSGFVEFTVLTQDEGSWCDILTYCIFDRGGKLVDRFMVAASCGDGGWSYAAGGKFLSDRRYQCTTLEMEMEGIENNLELYTVDSTVSSVHISPEGKAMKQILFKEKKQRTYALQN